MDHDHLERMLLGKSAELAYLPISFLQSITNNFSEDRKIGSGGFADVYKGLLRNGTVVAVKKLKLPEMVDPDEKKFQQEISSLMKLKHENIVRILGYCADTQSKLWPIDNKYVMAEERQRFLCFEFVPEGSLDKHIKGLDWRTCYHIIKGICMGLHYLHQNKIVHLDLKPANVLLHHYNVPKIADFGLARCFDEEQTWVRTSNKFGTPGYMAPEYIRDGVITLKSDIYSLGIVIIEILTGQKEGNLLVENVLESWSTRFRTSEEGTWLQHVRVCAKIGLECMSSDPEERPTIQRIIESLEELYTCGSIETDISATHVSSAASMSEDQAQSMDMSTGYKRKRCSVAEGTGESSSDIRPGSSETRNLVNIHPLEVRFHLEPNWCTICPVNLTNKTQYYVGIWIIPTCPRDTRFEFVSDPESSSPFLFTRINPRSTCVVSMRPREHQEGPSPDLDKFEVLIIVMGSKDELIYLESTIGDKLNMDNNFSKRVEKLGGKVHREVLTAMICDPASCPAVVTRQIKAKNGLTTGGILSVAMHPIETWILMWHQTGDVFIWNYQTQRKVRELQITNHIYRPQLFRHNNAKFIPGEHWFAVGDGTGRVHVYAYTTFDKVAEFEAHDKPISALAVHPTDPLLLSGTTDPVIKLWDWSQGWVCTRKFDGCRTCWGAFSFMFDPTDTSTFVSAGHDNSTTQVWNIHSSDAITTFSLENAYQVDYFSPDSHGSVLVTRSSVHRKHIHIWDLKKQERIHNLRLQCSITSHFACHPTLPILATAHGNNGSTICLWDAKTYRAEKIVGNRHSPIQYMALTGTRDSTRFITVHICL